MFYVYLLKQSKSGELYIGYTSNLKRRLLEHNKNYNKSTTRNEGSWILVYYEAYKSQTDAESREKKLKAHGSGKHELYKRLQNSLCPETGAGGAA